MLKIYGSNKIVLPAEVDPESRNCGSSHLKRPFIRDETELEINTL
jgi:hypothetical protein